MFRARGFGSSLLSEETAVEELELVCEKAGEEGRKEWIEGLSALSLSQKDVEDVVVAEADVFSRLSLSGKVVRKRPI
jgi:hypothetical protein